MSVSSPTPTPTRAEPSFWCAKGKHKGCPIYEDIICGCKCHPREARELADGEWLIELPITKPMSLNDRSHWSQKAEDVAQLRADAGWCVREAKVARCQKVRVTMIYEPRDKRRRDKDNLVATLKPIVDALVDTSVIPDDTPEHVEYEMPLIDVPNGRQGRITVLVERLL